MVANSDSDKLWGVFIKDLASVDLEEDGKLKAQRLNVGFSRAKESVHFVLSKPLDGYNGAIGEALRHFWSVCAEAKREHAATEVDPRSAREAEVLNWFYQRVKRSCLLRRPPAAHFTFHGRRLLLFERFTSSNCFLPGIHVPRSATISGDHDGPPCGSFARISPDVLGKNVQRDGSHARSCR